MYTEEYEPTANDLAECLAWLEEGLMDDLIHTIENDLNS